VQVGFGNQARQCVSGMLSSSGYFQIPETDFQDSYCPVLNDVAVRILFSYTYMLLNIDTAFLNGNLEFIALCMDN
jgi:hypothetical protein